MAAGKVTVSEGMHANSIWLDQGTLARTHAQVPGPICLYGNPNRLYAGPGGKKGGGTATAAPKSGIFVHMQSSIQAADWVAKINANTDVPDYFKSQIHSSDKDRLIYLTNAQKFMVPDNVIPKGWTHDWLSAFMTTEWEMTTGVLEITVDKPVDPKSKDPKKSGPSLKGTVTPDLSNGETIKGVTGWAALGERSNSLKDFKVELGCTVPNGIELASGRKTIVIAAQVKMVLGGKPGSPISVTDAELVNTWFHEIACHAGRVSQNKSSIHGDREGEVDAIEHEIDEMIPQQDTLDKILKEVQAFLSPDKTPGHP